MNINLKVNCNLPLPRSRRVTEKIIAKAKSLNTSTNENNEETSLLVETVEDEGASLSDGTITRNLLTQAGQLDLPDLSTPTPTHKSTRKKTRSHLGEKGSHATTIGDALSPLVKLCHTITDKSIKTQLPIARNHLRSVFKAETGKTFPTT